MATLKALRDRRTSVQSTQKITLAMKMVAGAKLRKAQSRLEAGRPYATGMRKMLQDLATHAQALEVPQPLLSGTGKQDTHLLVVMTSDRGLCGSFNASIFRHSRKLVASLQKQGQRVQILCIGKKGRDFLSRDYEDLLVESFVDIAQPRLLFAHVQSIAESILKRFADGQFDVCTIIYNHFRSAITQEITTQQLIPIPLEVPSEKLVEEKGLQALYEYEPQEDKILGQLLPHNIAVQLFGALLENEASEQGARMTAMDSASRNASDMIRKLELAYNRTRQAHITRELIEIISGAEAL